MKSSRRSILDIILPTPAPRTADTRVVSTANCTPQESGRPRHQQQQNLPRGETLHLMRNGKPAPPNSLPLKSYDQFPMLFISFNHLDQCVLLVLSHCLTLVTHRSNLVVFVSTLNYTLLRVRLASFFLAAFLHHNSSVFFPLWHSCIVQIALDLFTLTKIWTLFLCFLFLVTIVQLALSFPLPDLFLLHPLVERTISEVENWVVRDSRFS